MVYTKLMCTLSPPGASAPVVGGAGCGDRCDRLRKPYRGRRRFGATELSFEAHENLIKLVLEILEHL